MSYPFSFGTAHANGDDAHVVAAMDQAISPNGNNGVSKFPVTHAQRMFNVFLL
jgi:hypothetical protein